MKRKLTRLAMMFGLVLALVPTMGSDGCDRRGGYGYSGFDFGFDYLPSFGGFDFFNSGYEESYYYEDSYYDGGSYYDDYYYDDGYYYGDGYYDDFWKKKGAGKPGK